MRIDGLAMPSVEYPTLKAGQAARDFESLMLAQLLRAARTDGWMETADAATETAYGYAEEQLASSLAAQGGLGLARLITISLETPSVGQSELLRSKP